MLMVYSSGRNTAWLELNRDGNIDSSSSSLMQFRPIRSEADKKRDEAITKMVKQIGITPESAAMCYDFCTRVNKK